MMSIRHGGSDAGILLTYVEEHSDKTDNKSA